MTKPLTLDDFEDVPATAPKAIASKSLTLDDFEDVPAQTTPQSENKYSVIESFARNAEQETPFLPKISAAAQTAADFAHEGLSNLGKPEEEKLKTNWEQRRRNYELMNARQAEEAGAEHPIAGTAGVLTGAGLGLYGGTKAASATVKAVEGLGIAGRVAPIAGEKLAGKAAMMAEHAAGGLAATVPQVSKPLGEGEYKSAGEQLAAGLFLSALLPAAATNITEAANKGRQWLAARSGVKGLSPETRSVYDHFLNDPGALEEALQKEAARQGSPIPTKEQLVPETLGEGKTPKGWSDLSAAKSMTQPLEEKLNPSTLIEPAAAPQTSSAGVPQVMSSQTTPKGWATESKLASMTEPFSQPKTVLPDVEKVGAGAKELQTQLAEQRNKLGEARSSIYDLGKDHPDVAQHADMLQPMQESVRNIRQIQREVSLPATAQSKLDELEMLLSPVKGSSYTIGSHGSILQAAQGLESELGSLGKYNKLTPASPKENLIRQVRADLDAAVKNYSGAGELLGVVDKRFAQNYEAQRLASSLGANKSAATREYTVNPTKTTRMISSPEFSSVVERLKNMDYPAAKRIIDAVDDANVRNELTKSLLQSQQYQQEVVAPASRASAAQAEQKASLGSVAPESAAVSPDQELQQRLRSDLMGKATQAESAEPAVRAQNARAEYAANMAAEPKYNPSPTGLEAFPKPQVSEPTPADMFSVAKDLSGVVLHPHTTIPRMIGKSILRSLTPTQSLARASLEQVADLRANLPAAVKYAKSIVGPNSPAVGYIQYQLAHSKKPLTVDDVDSIIQSIEPNK